MRRRAGPRSLCCTTLQKTGSISWIWISVGSIPATMRSGGSGASRSSGKYSNTIVPRNIWKSPHLPTFSIWIHPGRFQPPRISIGTVRRPRILMLITSKIGRVGQRGHQKANAKSRKSSARRKLPISIQSMKRIRLCSNKD